MIRGLSYQNGVFYLNKKHIACSEMKGGVIVTSVRPISLRSMMWLAGRIILSMPIIYHLCTLSLAALVVYPEWFTFIPLLNEITVPWTIFLLGPTFTHLLFPSRLKKFHGAEHKVFSLKGKVTVERFEDVRKAAITNKYCSTNFVVAQLIILFISFLAQVPFIWSVLASFFGAVIIQRIKFPPFQKLILRISYFLQKWVTTKEPDDNHINVAIHSYQALMAAQKQT